MMTPMNTDLMKHSTRTAPSEHERAALQAMRRARRARFLGGMAHLFASLRGQATALRRAQARTAR